MERKQGPEQLIEQKAERIWEELCSGNFEALGLGSLAMDTAIDEYLVSCGNKADVENEFENICEVYDQIIKVVAEIILERGIECRVLSST